MSLTHHSQGRMKQRVGKKKGYKARETANQAFLKGTPREKLTGNLRRWVDRKYFRHNRTHTCFIFEGFLYVFNDKRELKTVIPAPQRFLRELKIGGKLPQIKSGFQKQRKVSEAYFL